MVVVAATAIFLCPLAYAASPFVGDAQILAAILTLMQ